MTPDDLEPAAAPPRWRGIVRNVVFPAAVLAVIVGGLWYWDSRQSNGSNDQYGTVELPADKNATNDSPAPRVGRAAPDFVLERADGGTLRLSDLQGKPVLLNFWTTWCPPCRAEVPHLVDAYDAHRDDGLVIVGVDLQEPSDMVRDFADEFGVEYPLVVDRDGDVADSWRVGATLEGLPTSYFIDADGVVRSTFLGPMTDEYLNEHLPDILPEASG